MLGTYHLAALFDILNKIHFVYEPPKLWQFVLEQACQTVQAEAGTFFQLSADETHLRASAVFGIEEGKLVKNPFQVGMGISGWVAQFHQPALVNDVRQDNRFNRGVDLSTGFVTKSLLCIPVFSQKKSYGVLEVLNKKSGQFSPQDQEFMTLLGRQAAVAYQNLIHLEESIHTKVLLESLLANMSGGLVAVGQDGKVNLMNPAAGKLLFMEPSVMVGKAANLVFLDLPWFARMLEQTFKTGAVVSRQETMLSLGGARVRLGYSTILLSDHGQRLLGAGIIFQKLA